MTRATFPIASAAAVRRRLAAIVRLHRGELVVIILLFGVTAVAGLVPPWLVGRLIDRLGQGAGIDEVTAIGVAMAASVVVQAVGVLVATQRTRVLGELVFAELREQFMADALFLPITAVEDAGTGELVNRTTQDVGAVADTVRFALPQILVAGVTILLTVVAGFVVSPVVAPVFLLAAPILVIAMRWYLRRALPIYLAESAAYGPIFAAANETIEGSRTVDALSLAEQRDSATDHALAEYWRVTVPVINLHLVLYPWTNVAFAVPVIAALAWGGWLATAGLVSVGSLATLALYAIQLAAPLETIIRWIDELQHGFAAFARLLGVSEVAGDGPGDTAGDGPGDTAGDGGDAPAPAVPGSTPLALRDVRFAYREGHEVLHGVSLQTRPGERLAIVGSSGAGKSTIARLLSGMDAPTSGRATVGDVDLTALPLEARRREVLLVTQESHVFATSIAENVRLGDETATDAAVLAALDVIGAGSWVAELPDRLDTAVGDGGHRLSGAQEQQIALARIVLADPHTLILDEATSLLDPRAARTLEASMAAVLRGRTVIAIAHRLHTAYDADRIAVVEEGRVLESGSHDELLASGGRYAALWHAWRDDGIVAPEPE